jgi:hypothetical protein
VPSPAGWAPSLVAANEVLPTGGWILAWAYGSTADHTGLVIYSGMDADAFRDSVPVNYALKELAIELGAQFTRSPASCSPGCSAPPAPAGGSGGGSGIGAPTSPTFAQCSFSRQPSRSWLHGQQSLALVTSVAAGMRGVVVTQQGKVVGSAPAKKPGSLKLPVNTKLLPSNRSSKVRAVVYVNAAVACQLTASLKVDNVKPKLLTAKVDLLASGKYRLTVSANESVRVYVMRGTKSLKRVFLAPRKTVKTLLPAAPNGLRLLVIDRANNTITRRLG